MCIFVKQSSGWTYRNKTHFYAKLGEKKQSKVYFTFMITNITLFRNIFSMWFKIAGVCPCRTEKLLRKWVMYNGVVDILFVWV